MHAHERIDPRRGPKRDRNDARREIDAGVTEYEEDRDAERASLYDSSDDWGFNWAEDFPDDEDHLEDYPMDDSRADAHEPVDDDARIHVTADHDKIVIEVLPPANMPTQGLAKYVEELTRRIARDLSLVGGGKVGSEDAKTATPV